MATNHHFNNPPQRYSEVRTEIHEAFNHVALRQSCTLPMLLEETRSRGINDDDVRNLLILDETETAAGLDTDLHFRCGRSNAGVLYITRDTGPQNELTSAFEAFADLWRHDHNH